MTYGRGKLWNNLSEKGIGQEVVRGSTEILVSSISTKFQVENLPCSLNPHLTHSKVVWNTVIGTWSFDLKLAHKAIQKRMRCIVDTISICVIKEGKRNSFVKIVPFVPIYFAVTHRYYCSFSELIQKIMKKIQEKIRGDSLYFAPIMANGLFTSISDKTTSSQ